MRTWPAHRALAARAAISLLRASESFLARDAPPLLDISIWVSLDAISLAISERNCVCDAYQVTIEPTEKYHMHDSLTLSIPRVRCHSSIMALHCAWIGASALGVKTPREAG